MTGKVIGSLRMRVKAFLLLSLLTSPVCPVWTRIPYMVRGLTVRTGAPHASVVRVRFRVFD